LNEALLKVLAPPERTVQGQFKMPIDHAFAIKGTGTVLTGTIHRGRLSVGDLVEVFPTKQQGRIKSIQVFRKPRKEAKAGDRIGVAVTGINPQRVSRGCYLASPSSLQIVQEILIEGKINSFYKGDLHPKMMAHLTIGMPTVSGIVYPYVEGPKEKIIRDRVEAGEDFRAWIRLTEKITAEEGDPILISRLDLPATTLRILANGRVIAINPKDLQFVREKIKQGVVRNAHHKGYVIEQLAQSKIGAEHYVGATIHSASGTKGKILEAFGTKGAVIATIGEKLKDGELIFMKKLKRFKP
jgi:selenocysteine-specific elongation factor